MCVDGLPQPDFCCFFSPQSRLAKYGCGAQHLVNKKVISPWTDNLINNVSQNQQYPFG
jgi:hypothetical protein